MKLYHFSGAGNNFVVLDGRGADMAPFRVPERIVALCTQYHTDGLMILCAGEAASNSGDAASSLRAEEFCKTNLGSAEAPPRGPGRTARLQNSSATPASGSGVVISSEVEKSPSSLHGLSVQSADFRMEFYNPDGSGGMMCGNGGRCIAAFADYLGIRPGDGSRIFRFLAPDGPHTAELLAKDEKGWTIRLGMKDVSGVTPVLGGYFLDTGTRHYVRFVDDVEALDIEKEGPRYRHDPAFAPIGANANFVQRLPGGGIKVRTFEKGVEGETLACGTGITASAIAAWFSAGEISRQARNDKKDASLGRNDSVHTPVRARQDDLSVDFTPVGPDTFTAVYLTGPAVLLATYEI